MIYKYIVSVIGIDISDIVFATDSDEAKKVFCRKRGLAIDLKRLTARRTKEE